MGGHHVSADVGQQAVRWHGGAQPGRIQDTGRCEVSCEDDPDQRPGWRHALQEAFDVLFLGRIEQNDFADRVKLVLPQYLLHGRATQNNLIL